MIFSQTRDNGIDQTFRLYGTAWQTVLSDVNNLPRRVQTLVGSEDQGVNLLDYGMDQRSLNLVRGSGNVIGVLALSGLFGSAVELVVALCWFIPHIMVGG